MKGQQYKKIDNNMVTIKKEYLEHDEDMDTTPYAENITASATKKKLGGGSGGAKKVLTTTTTTIKSKENDEEEIRKIQRDLVEKFESTAAKYDADDSDNIMCVMLNDILDEVVKAFNKIPRSKKINIVKGAAKMCDPSKPILMAIYHLLSSNAAQFIPLYKNDSDMAIDTLFSEDFDQNQHYIECIDSAKPKKTKEKKDKLSVVHLMDKHWSLAVQKGVINLLLHHGSRHPDLRSFIVVCFRLNKLMTILAIKTRNDLKLPHNPAVHEYLEREYVELYVPKVSQVTNKEQLAQEKKQNMSAFEKKMINKVYDYFFKQRKRSDNTLANGGSGVVVGTNGTVATSNSNTNNNTRGNKTLFEDDVMYECCYVTTDAYTIVHEMIDDKRVLLLMYGNVVVSILNMFDNLKWADALSMVNVKIPYLSVAYIHQKSGSVLNNYNSRDPFLLVRLPQAQMVFLPNRPQLRRKLDDQQGQRKHGKQQKVKQATTTTTTIDDDEDVILSSDNHLIETLD